MDTGWSVGLVAFDGRAFFFRQLLLSEKWAENKMEVARSFRRLEKVEKATIMKNSRGCKAGKNESCPIVQENTNLQQPCSDCLLDPSIGCRGGKARLD